MSGSFKTFPKPILVQNDSDCSPSRQDRFGNKFRYLEQKISFKDEILERPIESIIEYDQVELDIDYGSIEENTLKKYEKRKKKLRRKKRLKKMCSCILQ
jgi:hypothetical protein